MGAGQMRERFDLMEFEATLDADGYETMIPVRVSTNYCEVVNVDSREVSGNSVHGQETLTLRVRFSKQMDNPNTTAYIVFKGSEYDITTTNNLQYRNRYIDVLCIKRVGA